MFEEYDMPGIKMENTIASAGGAKTAWFKDSEREYPGREPKGLILKASVAGRMPARRENGSTAQTVVSLNSSCLLATSPFSRKVLVCSVRGNRLTNEDQARILNWGWGANASGALASVSDWPVFLYKSGFAVSGM